MRKNNWVLEDEEGNEAQIDDTIVSFRDEKYVLQGGAPPHKPSSTGKVYVSLDDPTSISVFYPSVFKLKWRLLNKENKCV